MQLFEALKILADTKENQVAYLVGIGTFPSTDELALQFADTYQVLKVTLDKDGDNISIDEEILKNLDNINSLFNDMSNISNNCFWNVSSLDDREWTKVRELARKTLQLMLI